MESGKCNISIINTVFGPFRQNSGSYADSCMDDERGTKIGWRDGCYSNSENLFQ